MNGEVKKHLYVTVTMDTLNTGFNMCCWLTTMPFWIEEITMFPHDYTIEQSENIFHLHSNCELTNKMVNTMTTQMEDILLQQRATNATRKLANR